MPKSFLMSGKRKKLLETLYHEEAEKEDDHETSTDSSDDSGVPESLHSFECYQQARATGVSHLHISARSAFEPPGRCSVPLSRAQLSEYYNHTVFSPTRKFQQTDGPYMKPTFFPPISVPPLPRVCTRGLSQGSNYPWTSVDTSIPFTTYLLNLTKLLKSSATRADDTRPDNAKSEPSLKARLDEVCDSSDSEQVVKHGPSSSSDMPVLKHHLNCQPISSFSNILPAAPVPHPAALGSSLSPQVGTLHPAFLQLGAIPHRRHTGDKPPPLKKYKCDVCGKAFSRSNTLVTHKRIHTGDKPFKCEQCGRAFRQPGNLTRHRLTHTTYKPYICSVCNKAFNRASNLHTHMRTHTNYKPFACPYCGKGFHQKIDMKIHSYTHTGERPYKCDVCGKGFTLSSTLNAHRRIHAHEDSAGHAAHHEPSFCCPVCGSCFTYQDELSWHMMNLHQNFTRPIVA